MTRDEAISLMIQLEGGYVDRPDDPGGVTKFGITQRTLNSFQHMPVLAGTHLPTNVKDLTAAQAAAIYRTVQWANIHGDSLAPALAVLLLNSAVNMGEPSAIMLLQSCVGVPQDGVMGPHTLEAVATWRPVYMPEQTLAEEFCAHVAARYAKLDAREDQFELGWFRRLFRVYTAAAFP